MSQILYLDPTSPEEILIKNTKLFDTTLNRLEIKPFRQLSKLLEYVSVKGASELDLHYPTIAIINDFSFTSNENYDTLPEGSTKTPLNTLPYEDIKLLFHHHYKHLNVISFKLSEFSITEVNDEILKYHKVLINRIVRMKSWIGMNNEHAKHCPCLHSMTNCLNIILQNDFEQSLKLRNLVLLINQEISFLDLLELEKPHEFYLHCIGNWGFIAHELTCDESTYCALQIFKIAFSILDPKNSLILDDNAILSFLFSLRDSYRGGNAFHNFRHAVDVLQASFYILICLDALPKFEQFTQDTNIHPVQQLINQFKNDSNNFKIETALLHPIQTLALLVSSIGHDVGHPGLTNPFLINHRSPIAKIYSNQSVLENYHSTIFQDILSNHWPIFLDNEHTENPINPLNTKKMQVESIIATDMASHFDYVTKIHEISKILSSNERRLKVKDSLKETNVILSMIIKCADISNVSRPLLISAKWGIVLGREFQETAQLGLHLKESLDIESIIDDRRHVNLPKSINDVVNNLTLAKGQIFFIDTFANSLFKEVCEVLPELQFLTDLIGSNKKFWLEIIEKNKE